jgi:hypothetical protein
MPSRQAGAARSGYWCHSLGGIMRGCKHALFVVAVAAATMSPWAAYAQSGASIAGVVRDASGAVLPGVTVEASSPVLIEKTRTAVTDGGGQFRITELLPGTYAVTFGLTGFSTVKREGLEVSGSFTLTLNVDMKIGNVSETITVSGEPPIVDLQSTTRQTVVTRAQADALPTGRNMFNLGVLIPGVTLTTGGLANQDVGGALGPNTLALGIHGGQTQDQRLTMNGVSLSTMIGGGWGGGTIPNQAGVSETLFDTSSVDASLSTGGVRINFIAKDGGNRFEGTVFANFANDSMQGNNFTPRLQALGLTTPGGIVKNWDFNPGFGGPIAKDRLWFFLSGRSQGANTLVPGQFYNKNENNPNAWAYEPDTSRPATLNRSWQDYQARVTWQANQKNKFGFLYNIQSNCFCPFAVASLVAPEAGNDQRFPLQRPIEVDWTSPVTSKLLLEGSAIHRIERWGAMDPASLAPGMISVTDTGPGAYRPGMTYRSAATYSNNLNTTVHWRFNASYITGAHAFKAGINDAWGSNDATTYTRVPYSYGFFTPVGAAPTPATITQYPTPYTTRLNVDHDFGMFVQDRWTSGRSTLSLGVRYDHASSSYPEATLGPTPLAPGRNLTFPDSQQVSWSDITPKAQFSYDLRGDGKTAVKISINKYLQGFGSSFAIVPDPNPVSAAVGNNGNRPWTDANRNYIPDCNLASKDANGECGALDNPNFGSNDVAALLRQLRFDQNLQTGWGKRGYNWEFSAGVQHQLAPRMSIDVGFFRRWYGNFQVVDNEGLNSATDFNYFNYTTPADSRLPGGGNYTVTGFPVVKPTVGFGGFLAQNLNVVKLSDDVGRQIQHWNGVDVNLTSRLRSGFFAQGGFSTGRTATDNCEVIAKLPEVAFESNNFFSPFFFSTMPTQFCKRDGVFLTQVKGSAAYLIPKIDVNISGTYQNLPGVDVEARANVPFKDGVGGLQSLPFAANFHVIEPGTLTGERLNQVDLRIGKRLTFGRTRTTINFDVYNLLNVDTVTQQNNGYFPVPGGTAVWQVPSLILQARFIKIGAQFEF